MPLEGLGFCENVGNIGTIYTADPLLQKMALIVCLRGLIFDVFNYKPPSPC